MGNYNPRAPQLLGQEWVPIRDEDLVFTPSVNAQERGHGFTLSSSQQVNNARYYANDIPAPSTQFQTMLANVYPQGSEASSGPIKQVIIPVNSGAITGAQIIIGAAATVAEALQMSGDGKAIQASYDGGNINRLSFTFGVNQYPMLAGKRILNVSMIYSGYATDSGNVEFLDPNLLSPATSFTLSNGASLGINFAKAQFANTGALTLTTRVNPFNFNILNNLSYQELNLGDVNHYWNPAAALPSAFDASADAMPWRFQDLQRLEIAAANQLFGWVRFQVPLTANGTGTNARMNLEYVALRVVYCEETRVIYGALRGFQELGTNVITMRDLAHASNPTLLAGNYTATMSLVNPGDIDQGSGVGPETPTFNALRQLYEIPPHPGVAVNIPFPYESRLGATFTKESINVLPQLSLHSSTVALTGPHVYGRQAAAEVYGNVMASQDIDDSIIGTNKAWPQVRYYTRRFGNTTVPLTLGSPNFTAGLSLPAESGNYASTPDNAALDITGDIDLRVDLTLNDWSPLGNASPLTKWGTAALTKSYLIQVLTTGNLALAWSTDGNAVSSAQSTVALPFSGGTRAVIRATLDVDNGAAGRDITFFTGPTLVGPWTQLGAVVTQAGVTSIFNSTSQVEIGGHTNGTLDLFVGVVHAAQIRNGIGGTIVAEPNFENQPPGTTVFVDSPGRTWTINTSGSSSIASIIDTSEVILTPAEWDALPEIVDGWKEVTKRFTVSPTMGTINFDVPWRWSAIGEGPGNRWEVLGAVAPAISGTPGNNFNLALQQLYSATYLAPNGANAELTWAPQGIGSVPVSSPTKDDSADAVLIFAQDMPMITGFGVSVLSQAITGIGQQCGIDPCCIPSALSYNRITWPFPTGTSYARDSFNRTVVNGLGSADIGGPYTLTAAAANYQVNGTEAQIKPTASGPPESATLANIGTNFDITAAVGAVGTILVTGAVVRANLVGRFTDNNNQYFALLQTGGGLVGTSILAISKIVAGVGTDLLAVTVPISMDSNARVNFRFMGQGSILKAKAWPLGDPEPAGWQVEVVDTSLTTGTRAGISARTDNALGDAMAFDNLTITPPQYWFGAYELQRMDTVEPTWKTIMLATSPAVTGFNDYEARIGIQSSYRIRSLDVYNFPGPWSSTITATISAPGVTGGCVSQGHILTFSSNEKQSGSINLAYASVWMEQNVSEDFSFPEAEFVQLQAMYDRDFYTAFRPSERGGESFSRTVLVQAASIAPETLADFQSLRNMAWDAVNYICVRDEDGNRWFATVLVPSGKVLRDRRLYLAPIDIIEVTDTPTPVNPSLP